MSLKFPNSSRSYDATRHAVRFWGYDTAMEWSFFVTAEALAIVKRNHKARAWLARYPRSGFVDEETYDASTHRWKVKLGCVSRLASQDSRSRPSSTQRISVRAA